MCHHNFAGVTPYDALPREDLPRFRPFVEFS